jgi:hypothetical protein
MLVAVLMVLSGCSDDSESGAAADSATTTTVNRSVSDQPDSCALFSASEVASLVGGDVVAGADTGAGQGCYFAATSNGRSLLVNLQTGDSAAKFADSRSNAGEQTTRVQDLSDVADEAFVYSPEGGDLASAEARQGAVRVRMVITGVGSTVEMAKKALLAALPRVASI